MLMQATRRCRRHFVAGLERNLRVQDHLADPSIAARKAGAYTIGAVYVPFYLDIEAERHMQPGLHWGARHRRHEYVLWIDGRLVVVGRRRHRASLAAFNFAPASTQVCWREYSPFLSDYAPRCQSIVARWSGTGSSIATSLTPIVFSVITYVARHTLLFHACRSLSAVT